jgi:hypothetical protein
MEAILGQSWEGISMSKPMDTEKDAEKAMETLKDAIDRAESALEELRRIELQDLDEADLESLEMAFLRAWAATKVRAHLASQTREPMQRLHNVLGHVLNLFRKAQADVRRREPATGSTGEVGTSRTGAFARYTRSGT